MEVGNLYSSLDQQDNQRIDKNFCNNLYMSYWVTTNKIDSRRIFTEPPRAPIVKYLSYALLLSCALGVQQRLHSSWVERFEEWKNSKQYKAQFPMVVSERVNLIWTAVRIRTATIRGEQVYVCTLWPVWTAENECRLA